MLDRTFVRPIAHRGLHDAKAGVIENTAPAFAAAIAKGYGIECDLRPAADGTPIVFHDERLDRLVEARGEVAALSPAELTRLAYRRAGSPGTRIITFADLIDLVDGHVPMLVEVKSEWGPPDAAFMKAMKPSAALGAVIGSNAMPRTEVTKKIWAYIKKHGLQDSKNRRNINADDALKAVFGGKKQVSMFEMTKLVNKHLS